MYKYVTCIYNYTYCRPYLTCNATTRLASVADTLVAGVWKAPCVLFSYLYFQVQ